MDLYLNSDRSPSVDMNQYLYECERLDASDMHMTESQNLVFRIDGALVEGNHFIPTGMILPLLEEFLNDSQLERLEQSRNIDIAYSLDNGSRFRMNIYYEQKHLAIATRRLDAQIKSLELLGLPKQLAKLPSLKDGLILVTGATGSGKSTTLACMINQINQDRSCHILTIEDPIEYVYESVQAVIHQREVGVDVPSFADAIRAAMREDPDVILLGEMRDKATMRAALMAAETGHLVFSTLHTNDAVGAIDRLIGAFPGDEQDGVRAQLSMVLRAVITQSLLKSDESNGRIPVNEILMVNNAVSNLIRQRKPEQIRSIMETGQADGNQTLEHALATLVSRKLLSVEQAKKHTQKKSSFEESLRIILSGMSKA